MVLNQVFSFLYQAQSVGLSAERTNLAGPLVLEALHSWKIVDKINKLKTFTVSLVKADLDRSKVFLERNVFIPAFKFDGIITGIKDINDDILSLTIKEKGWHFGRRIYKIEDSLKEYNLSLTPSESLPDVLEDLIGSMNVNMPIVDSTVVPGLVSLWRLNGTPNDDKGSRNGTWTGTPGYTAGKYYNDQASIFDGFNYIKTGVSTHNYNLPFSFSFIWKAGNQTGAPRLISTENVSAKGILLYSRTGTQLSLFIRHISDGVNIEKQLNVNVNDNIERIITVTYNGSGLNTGINWYINGLPQTNFTVFGSGPLVSTIITAEDLTIGATPAGSTIINANSIIDDVRDYDIELTATQVLKLFKQTQSGIDTIVERDIWKLGEGNSMDIPDLISLWKLDNNALDSKGSNDGTVTGTTPTYVNGKYNKALDFNGIDTKIDCGSDVSLDDLFDNGGTITTIINPRSDGEGNEGTIIAKRIGGYLLKVLNESGGFLRLEFFYDFDTTDGRWQTAIDIPINEITIIGVSYDNGAIGNNPIIYINGKPRTIDNGLLTEISTPVGTRVSDAANNLIIGNVTGQTSTFDGWIDDVRMYNKIKPQKEIKRLFDAKFSYVDKIRNDDIPDTAKYDIDIKWKKYHDVLRTIALNTLNDLWFEGRNVMFGTKGKTITLDRDDKIYEKLSSRIDLESYGNIVNVVGAKVTGVNVHAQATAAETDLLYDYEKVISNNNLTSQVSVDDIVGRLLDENDSIEPDVSIGVKADIIHKYNFESGDVIKIPSNNESQTVKGFYRIIQVDLANTKSKIKLQFSKTGKFIPRLSDASDILEATMLKLQDIELNG